MKLTSFFLITLVGACAAQDFKVPSTWREFSTKKSRTERQTIAKAGIDQMAKQFNTLKQQYDDIGYWPTASTVLSAMTNFDRDTKTTTYKDFVTKTLNKAFALYKDYDQVGFNDDALWWGTASYYAFRAYGDKALLDHAVATWEHVLNFQITPDVAASGSLPPKKFKIKGVCDGVSQVGGVYWRPDADDTSVNSITTGLFMTLSAYLAKEKGDDKFKNAAIAAGNWIRNANMRADGLVLDTIHGDDCERSGKNSIYSYNSGKYVEGLVALHAVTKDAALLTETTKLAVTGMKNAPWQGSNGVITEGVARDKNDDGAFFKSIWVRALYEMFKTVDDQTPIGTLIHSYIDVQYNALLGLAATGSTYSSAWNGPPQGFTAWGQAAALDVLVAAITANT